ncbi:MAG: hypothetical protein V3V57_05080 [Spirochaetia bacterium]
MKAAFPLPVDQITEVYRVFRLPVPNREKQTCTFAEFAEMAKKNKRLLAVNVDKVRDLYDVDGCIVESATVKFNGEEFKPVAAEDPDPAKVKATMEKLGLWGQENINYVQGIKRAHSNRLLRAEKEKSF